MLHELELPHGDSRLWSRPKILLVFLVPPLLFLAFFLIYDERLEPAPDLVPAYQGAGAGKNGLVMLRSTWETLPEVQYGDLRQWAGIIRGEYLWDDGLVVRLNPSARNLRQDLTDALNAPEWEEEMASVQYFLDNKGNLAPCFQAMMASAMQKVRAGERREAVSLIRDLRRLAARQFKGAWSWDGLDDAMRPTGQALDLTCDLVAGSAIGQAELAELVSIWEPEDLSGKDLANPAAGEARFLAEMLSQDAAKEYRFGYWIRHGVVRPSISNAWWQRYLGLMIRRNATMNEAHRIIRSVRDNALAVSSKREGSLTAALQMSLPAGEHWSMMLDSNAGGELFLISYVIVPSLFMERETKLHLFRIRAMRIWLALRRWQLVHAGTLPASLSDLIPDYMASIPADPWNGSPLRWDATEKIIYGVGTDWNPDVPRPSDLDGRWIAKKSEGAFDYPNVALRFELPPRPKPAVAYPAAPVAPISKRTPKASAEK